MKKSLIHLLGVTAILCGATSCSEQVDEPAAGANGGLTSVSVSIPVADPASRAMPEIPEGYKLRCIMQLVDATGAPMADARYTEEVNPGSESVEFSFIAPEGYQGAMFWADYVKALDADYIYSTTDLKAVDYNTANAAEAFNNPAADAFYGYMLAGNNSIALTRPFTRLTFKNADAAYDSYTTVKVTDMAAPAGFNVMNGNTASYATGLASSELTIGEDGRWFSAYLFVGNNSGANLGAGHDIALTLGGAQTTSVTLGGAQIPLTRNYDLTALVSATSGDVTDVTVTFPGGMVDPDAPRDIKVGDFLNADGKYSETFDPAKTVAIVYALAIPNTTENGKEVAAYAFALSNAARLKVSDANTDFAGTAVITNETYAGAAGPADWDAFKAVVGADNNMVKSLADWVAEHPVTGSNLSAWYAPTPSQMVTLVGCIFNGGEWTIKNGSKLTVEFPARDNAVYDSYLISIGADGYFTHNNSVANFFTSALGMAEGASGVEGKIAAVQVDEKNHTIGVLASGLTGMCLIRPVISIYK